MRIAWFTPFTRNSAIGKYSQVVTDGLSKSCEVDIWSSESDNLLSTGLKVVHYQPNDDLQILKNYDYIIYNIGDTVVFHKTIFDISRKIKGIVILHDLVMHHFFVMYYIHIKNDPDAYINEMAMLYGAKGRNAAVESIDKKHAPIWETDEVMDYPFFEKTIEGAVGVIVHSKYLADRVEPKFLGPVDVIYSPFYSYDSLKGYLNTNRSDLGLPLDKVIIVTVGHVNPNKRIDKVIEILGEERELAEKVLYIIIGPYEKDSSYFSHIMSIVKKYCLENVVRFLGFQSEEKLRAYLSKADMFINLRYPAMEGASWSLIEELYFGKPVVVINTGFYREIPDDCVVKIDPLNENINLHRSLRKLIYDKHMREEIGIKGQKFAFENFNVDRYCDGLFKFLNNVQDSKPMLNLVDKVGKELGLMGASDDMGVIDKAAREIYMMFK